MHGLLMFIVMKKARTPGTPRLDAQKAKYSFPKALSTVFLSQKAIEYRWHHTNVTRLPAVGDWESVGDGGGGGQEDSQNNLY